MIKVLIKSSNLRSEEHGNYFKDIIYRIIKKVRTIGNLR